MTDEKRAAIDVDKLGKMTLSEISAADFLEVLKAGSGVEKLTVWPEKKKLELWAEPENISVIKVREFIDLIRGEKKKYEYEVDPWHKVMPLEVLDRLVNNLSTVLKERQRG